MAQNQLKSPNVSDQIRAQNTSLDSKTANKSKQQPKSSLKARYESKTGLKITRNKSNIKIEVLKGISEKCKSKILTKA